MAEKIRKIREIADILEDKPEYDLEEALCVEQYTNYDYQVVEYGEKCYVLEHREAAKIRNLIDDVKAAA